MNKPPHRPLLILTGPTATGKSAIACVAAKELDAEIVCADSRQIYKGLEIGSAAPTELHGVPHHLFGVLSPDEPSSAGSYRDMARPVIASIHDRGKFPMLVGGTGLYLSAVTGEIGLAPPLKPSTAERLGLRLEKEGPDALYRELLNLDPASASNIEPGDSQRVIRALGILIDTGKSRGSYANRREQPYYPVSKAALSLDRRKLYTRIDERSKLMFRSGVLEEARKLRQAGYGPNLPALKSIGYRYLYEVLEGKLSEAEAIDLMSRDTRRYAKRQMTWLRGRSGIFWIDSEDPEAAAKAVVRHFRSSIQEETKCA